MVEAIRERELTYHETKVVEMVDTARILPDLFKEPTKDTILALHGLKTPIAFNDNAFIRSYYAAVISETSRYERDDKRPRLSKQGVLVLYETVGKKIFERNGKFVRAIDQEIA